MARKKDDDRDQAIRVIGGGFSDAGYLERRNFPHRFGNHHQIYPCPYCGALDYNEGWEDLHVTFVQTRVFHGIDYDRYKCLDCNGRWWEIGTIGGNSPKAISCTWNRPEYEYEDPTNNTSTLRRKARQLRTIK